MPGTYEIPEFNIVELAEALGLGPVHRSRTASRIFCPFTQHRTPGHNGTMRLYEEGDRAKRGGYVCHCDASGGGGSVWDFLSRLYGLPGYGSPDFDETILFVCDALGVDPEATGRERSPRDASVEIWRDIEKNLAPIGEDQLGHPHFEEGQEEVLWRGLPASDWYSAGVGYYSKEKAQELRRRYGMTRLEKAGISEWGGQIGVTWLSEGIFITKRSGHGSPVAGTVRRYGHLSRYGEGGPKYGSALPSPSFDPGSHVFGLSAARHRLRSGPGSVLWAAEGELDCLALRLRGLEPVVALSGVMSDGRRKTLEDLAQTPSARACYSESEDQSVTLRVVLDTDASGAGFSHGVKIAEHFRGAEFILLPTGSETDPEAFAREHGVSAITDLAPYTSLQIRAGADFQENPDWRASSSAAALEPFLEEIATCPSSSDEKNLKFLSKLAGADLGDLRSAVLGKRLQRAAEFNLKLS